MLYVLQCHILHQDLIGFIQKKSTSMSLKCDFLIIIFSTIEKIILSKKE